jgi:hypothetical protein
MQTVFPEDFHKATPMRAIAERIFRKDDPILEMTSMQINRKKLPGAGQVC